MSTRIGGAPKNVKARFVVWVEGVECGVLFDGTKKASKRDILIERVEGKVYGLIHDDAQHWMEIVCLPFHTDSIGCEAKHCGLKV